MIDGDSSKASAGASNGAEILRDSDGIWRVVEIPDEDETSRQFAELSASYLNAFDPAFERAKARCEFEFVCALLRIEGVQAAGWDPYETTLHAVPLIIDVNNSLEHAEAQSHLQLWIYLHIVEASAPPELLANLFRIAAGERYGLRNFRPQTNFGMKLKRLQELAKTAGVPRATWPVEQVWDREFRNAIAHADYALYRGELRIRNPDRRLSADEAQEFVFRAVAYHSALARLLDAHIRSYERPKVVDLHQNWKGPPGAQAVILVQEGRGAVGVQAAWSREEIAGGHILWRMLRCGPAGQAALDRDPMNWLLPPDGS